MVPQVGLNPKAKKPKPFAAGAGLAVWAKRPFAFSGFPVFWRVGLETPALRFSPTYWQCH